MAEKHDTVRGLVLAGGGAKGSYQVGVYQALMELGWLPDVITGASVGSLNAALFVMGKVNEAADLWRSLDNHGVLELPEGKTPEELRDFLLETLRGGGLNTEPLGQTIDQYMDENAIRASHIKYGLVITEMNTLRSVQCTLDDIPQGQLKDYMLASSACFPALRPYEIDGVKYIDGGWRDNMPLELAAKMGATELIGVDVDGVGLTRPNLTGLPTRIIRSHWDLGPLFDFDGVRAAKNIALGYMDTMREFGRLGGTAYGILPDENSFMQDFAAEYQAQLSAAISRALELTLPSFRYKSAIVSCSRSEKSTSRRSRLAVGSPRAYAARPWQVSCTVRHRNTDASRSSRSHREPKSSAFHKFSRYPTGLPPQNSIQVHYIRNFLRLQAKKNSRPHGAAVPAIAYRFSCFRASMGFSRRMRRVAYSMVANTTTNTLPTAMATLYHGI